MSCASPDPSTPSPMQMSYSRPLGMVLIVLLFALLAASPGLFAGQDRNQPAGAPPKLSAAVVDLERLYAESELRKTGTEELAAYRARVEQQGQQMSQEHKSKVDQLPELSPNSERHREIRREISMLEAQMQALQQVGTQELTVMRIRLELRFLDYARRAIAQVAEQRQIEIVLRKSPPVPQTLDLAAPDSARNIEAKMAQQMILYAAPNLDITADVLPVMNQMFQQENAGQGNASTRPAGGAAN